METIEAIKKQVSVKRFKNKPLKKNLLLKILDASMLAPSPGNVHVLRLIVVDDKGLIDKIAKTTLQPEIFNNVPYVVAVCSEPAKMKVLYPRHWEYYCVQAVVAATQNIILRATDLGVDTSWVRAFADETLKAVLGLPGELGVHAVLLFGYSGEETPYRAKRPYLAHYTWFNGWRNTASYTGALPLSKYVDRAKAKIKNVTKGTGERIKSTLKRKKKKEKKRPAHTDTSKNY